MTIETGRNNLLNKNNKIVKKQNKTSILSENNNFEESIIYNNIKSLLPQTETLSITES